MSAAILPQKDDKKVCIIIPVYNAEKLLGYCLNSILSQTYSNWHAILVNDGSSDSSLEICQRYAKLDSRFQVVSKANGGVSSARNTGLSLAEGDYLAFLDSDDCLATDALEKQVHLAVAYNSQLVVTGATMVDFNNPQGKHISLHCGWLEDSPCALSAAEFLEKRMRLIWHTALLEGPWAKLYDLALWKKLNLQFPADLSLGEDFVTNMTYYNACNSAVFLNEPCYYYNQSVGSGSLSEKYRADLFEIKMFLNEKMEEHLGGRAVLSTEERDAFYCYVASNGLSAVERTVLSSGLKTAQLHTRIQEMFAHPLFTESLLHASYIPDRFAACRKYFNSDSLDQLIKYIASDAYNKAQLKKARKAGIKVDAPQAVSTGGAPGRLNRWVCQFLQTTTKLAGQGRFAKRLTRLNRYVQKHGVRITIRDYLFKKTKKRTLASMQEELSAVHMQVFSLQLQVNFLQTQLATLEAQAAESKAPASQQDNNQ